MTSSTFTPRAVPSRLRALVLACAATLLPASAMAFPADRTATFAHGFSPAMGQAWTGAIQPDGKILFGGWVGNAPPGTLVNTDAMLARHLSDGSVDTAFGTGGTGTARTDVYGYGDAVLDMVETDAGVYALGYANDYTVFHNVLFRYTASGQLDTTFGNGGKLVLALPSTDRLQSLSVQEDGKLVLVGTAQVGSSLDYLVLRLNPDGTFDPGFVNGGRVTYSASSGNDVAYTSTLQTDGRILVVGETGMNEAAVMRLNTDGSTDTTFGSYGIARLSMPTRRLMGRFIAHVPEGLVLVGSDTVNYANGTGGTCVSRLRNDGSLDTMFNATGHQCGAYPAGTANQLSGMQLLPTGQTLVAGMITIDYGGGNGNRVMFSGRYTEGGAMDTSYDSAGTGMSIGGFGSALNVSTGVGHLGLLPDGQFHIGGFSGGLLYGMRFQGTPMDLVPDAPTVPAVENVARSTVQTSALFYVSGLSQGAVVPLTVSNGSYIRNGFPATSRMGYVANGDWIKLVHTSASTYNTSVTTTARFGGVLPANNRTRAIGPQAVASFTSTTLPLLSPPPGRDPGNER